MEKNDFIYCEKGAFSKEACDDYIKFFEDNIGIASPGGMHNNNSLDDLEICLDIEKCDRNLNDSIVKVVESYKKIYPLIDTRLGSWDRYYKCQLMKQLIWKTSKYWRSVTYHQLFEISLFDLNLIISSFVSETETENLFFSKQSAVPSLVCFQSCRMSRLFLSILSVQSFACFFIDKVYSFKLFI